MSDFYVPGQFTNNVSHETNNKPKVQPSSDFYVPGKATVIKPEVKPDFYVPGQITKKEREFPTLPGVEVKPVNQGISWAEKVKKEKEKKEEVKEKQKGVVPLVKEKNYDGLKCFRFYNINFHKFFQENEEELWNIFSSLMDFTDVFLDKLEDENGFKKFAYFIYQTYYQR
jgi:hypothetical protein